MHYKIAPLELKSIEKKAVKACEVYISQPNSDKEELAGKLFLILEMETKSQNDQRFINFLIDTLEHYYYESEKLVLRERVKSIKIDHIFEICLAKTNKALSEFIQNEKININFESIDAITGIIHDDGIYFAHLGKSRAFLIFKEKTPPPPLALNSSQANAPDIKYKIINVIEKTSQAGEKKPINPQKLFSSVISGTIPPGGYFVFSNEALSEYLSTNQMIGIVSSLPPISAVEQMKNILSQINAYVSFLSIIIKNTEGAPEDIFHPETVTPSTTKDSILNLNKVEDKTEKILAPGGYVNFGKWITGAFSIFGRLIPSFGSKNKKPELDTLKDRILFKKRVNFFSFGKFFGFFKNIFSFLISAILHFFGFITSKERILFFFKNLHLNLLKPIRGFGMFFANTFFWLKKLSLKNKFLLFIAAASIVVLTINIVIMNKRGVITKEKTDTENIIKEIEAKQNQIEANSLYNNEGEIKRLLDESRALIEKLPKDQNNDKRTQYLSFLDKYNEQLDKIRHITKLENLTTIADFSSIDKNSAPQNIVLLKDRAYVGDGAARNIYSIDLKTNLITSTTTNSVAPELKFPFLDKSEAINYLSGSSIMAFDPKTNKSQNFNIALGYPKENIAAAAFYNNKFYVLDIKDNLIYRYEKDKNIYGKETKWLGEPADLANGKSMDIDGNVYVLKSDGRISKFLKGKRVEFNLDETDPKIENANKLIFNDTNKFIYVLEASKQRIIVFDKDGKFILQYKSSKFSDLKDLVVDEKNKTLYILSGSILYKAAGEHFK